MGAQTQGEGGGQRSRVGLIQLRAEVPPDHKQLKELGEARKEPQCGLPTLGLRPPASTMVGEGF